MMAEVCRPSLPPVAWFAGFVWAGCVAAEVVCTRTGSLAVVVGACAVLAGLAMRAKRGRRTVALLVWCGLLVGLAVSGARWQALQQQRSIANDTGAREWSGVVEADPTIGTYGPVVRVRVSGGPLHGARVRIAWPPDEDVPDLGRTVRFSAILKRLPSDEPWAARMLRSGVCASGTAWTAETGEWRTGHLGGLYAWRARVLRRMHKVPGPGGDLLEGIVLGDRRRLLGTPADQDFRVLGLTHLVAVSGSHLALACAAVALMCRALRLPRRVAVPATVLAGAAYAVVTGLPYSALRSLLMLVVVGVGSLIGRRSDGLAALSVGVIAVLVIEPWATFDVGFQLSVLAVGALLVFGGLASAWMSAGLPRWTQPASEPLGLTLVAQAVTAPVIVSTFGMVSVLAPVANALVGALVSLALLLGLSGALGGGVAPPAGSLLLQAATAVLGATAWLASRMATVPGAAVAVAGSWWLPLLVILATAAVWAAWPVPKAPRTARRLLAAVLCGSVWLSLGPAPVNRSTLTVLDVGQGDAVLVQDSGRSMLVDAGPNEQSMRQALARTGLRAIDVLVLTHAHDDHTGGAAALGGLVELGWIGVPVGPAADGVEEPFPIPVSLAGTAVRALKAGDEWRVGRLRVRVLWPTADLAPDITTNDTSVVLMVSRGGFDAVLTGDAEEATQRGMGEEGLLTPIELLKVPHHGSVNGLTAEALRIWEPRTALISVGAGNDFGHPSSATLELLRHEGVSVVRTDQCGDIVVQVNDKGYRVRTQRTATEHGAPLIFHARMVQPSRMHIVPAHRCYNHSQGGARGRSVAGVPEARLSHLRRRGAVARPRAPPTA